MAKACTTSTSVGTCSSGTEAEAPSDGSLLPRREPGDVSITVLRLCVMDVTGTRFAVICSCLCTWNLPVSASAPDEEGVSVMNEGGFGRVRLGGDLVVAFAIRTNGFAKRWFQPAWTKENRGTIARQNSHTPTSREHTTVRKADH